MSTNALWIKISTDMFNDEAITLIESHPNGSDILLIWFKILCLAGASAGNGILVFKDHIPYNDEMLASVFHTDLPTVREALTVLEQFGLIEQVEGTYLIPSWDKYQGSEKLDRIREQNAARQRRFKERQRQKLLGETAGEEVGNVTDNVTVTAKSRIQSKSKSKSKNNNKDILSISDGSEALRKEVIQFLNAKTGSRYRHNTPKTKKLIEARCKEGFTLEDFKTVIEKKCATWLSDPKMSMYLRPETLFGTKFESYLNEIQAQCASTVADLPSEGGKGWLNEI